MRKTIKFDVEEVLVQNQGAYMTVEAETMYPTEVLEPFTPDEIIQYYGELEELYEALQEHFNEEE